MTPIAPPPSALSAYNREAVLSAGPAQLLTMLYDRLLLDLARAEAAEGQGDRAAASSGLIHAQNIVAELSSSLRTDAWDGAEGLLALYGFITTTLVDANVRRDPALTRQCIELLEPIRQSWHDAAAELASARTTASAGILGDA